MLVVLEKHRGLLRMESLENASSRKQQSQISYSHNTLKMIKGPKSLIVIISMSKHRNTGSDIIQIRKMRVPLLYRKKNE